MKKHKHPVAYYKSMMAHIEQCGLGIIGDKPQPLGILLYELEEKIVIDSSWGKFEKPAIAARDKVLAMLKKSQKKAQSKPNFEEDVVAPTNEAVEEIANLANLQLRQEQVVEGLTAQLKEAAKSLRKTQEQDLPEAMLNVGMVEFTTDTGVSVSVSETLYASIAKKNKPKAIKWLMDNGQSSLVKEDVNIPFDKGDTEAVQQLLFILEQSGYDTVVVNESVNTASVKAMIKELLADGTEVPLELFGAYFARKAVIKA